MPKNTHVCTRTHAHTHTHTQRQPEFGLTQYDTFRQSSSSETLRAAPISLPDFPTTQKEDLKALLGPLQRSYESSELKGVSCMAGSLWPNGNSITSD